MFMLYIFIYYDCVLIYVFLIIYIAVAVNAQYLSENLLGPAVARIAA
jgi:hypothetical protein